MGGIGSVDGDLATRAALERLAADDATDASDELRRLEQTSEALAAIRLKLSEATTAGLSRPPKWLLLSWHYANSLTACGRPAKSGPRPLRSEAQNRRRQSLPAVLSPRAANVAARVQAALQYAQRRASVGGSRGYDALPRYE